ncbi:hypothetical protein VP1G_00323 [Cytospora mali]|uniref:Stc1 domain-containing protein n=1 Tax=Cytospora mali TaxID=578113 RepID=A0A194UMR0_CYTMA|nr:hypothetical protein VP1G_00323 [Valsa mali var. pyri (nom. inval.)]
MENNMFPCHIGATGPAGFPANPTDNHANEVARVASDGSAIHEEIISVSAQQIPSSTLRSNSSAASSSEGTMQNSPEYTFQGAPRPNPKSGSRDGRRDGPANGEPSSSTAGQRGRKRKNPPDPSTSDEASHRPPAHRRRVLEYCAGCTERKSNGGNKKHHCEDCRYVDTDKDSQRASEARSTTGGPTSQTKAQKLYCEKCTARKNEPGEGDRIRKNAKHKCAKCREVRGQAVSPEESITQLQPQPEAEIEGPVDIDDGVELQPQPEAAIEWPVDIDNGEAAPWDNVDLQAPAAAEGDERLDVDNDEVGFLGQIDWTVSERARTQTPRPVENSPEPVSALGPAFNPWGSDVFLCPAQPPMVFECMWPWPN